MLSPDGDGGFPGALTTTLAYTVTRENALTLDYRAISDRPTVVNLTNHAYFALQGGGNGDVADQRCRCSPTGIRPAHRTICRPAR
ncbi:MAG TPA: hypothetical protein VFU28_20410 [Vicinamibacterales bacterium]|nr:hypothetical protein [Vicinamibacterales bacterium]